MRLQGPPIHGGSRDRRRWAVQREIDEGRIVTVPDDAIAVHLPVHVIWKSSPIVLPRPRVTIDAIVARARTAMER
ncbi:hypothetical protein FZ934_26470 (plasmid) [Rhizobium grahamii]|uniref:LysR substrate-binding domain-containing protein n=1 Tax=Rhizobium grahamii TaxID=1120045 RepID=A0A5Q0CHM9_9HYPH|nr:MULTISPECIES: hypothetical protein [Rhizobium]QFY63769.1 hypothetical protein FZ934_26470 [Rhizobium grahamii]QRM51470.1 hypothetical protein F3Y33_19175 [Rhizobium sp. BG6]